MNIFKLPHILSAIAITIYILVAIPLVINIINPKILWEKFESWKANSNPSTAYFKMRRITNLIALILLTLFFTFPTIMCYLTN